MQKNNLYNIVSLFQYYKQLGEKTFEQLSDEDLFWQYNSDSNSVAIIVHHLWGNMLSRWTDFLTTDGEKEWRQRDLEFENIIDSREMLFQRWEEGWQCLFIALETINENNIESEVYIRNQAHTVSDAINRQLAHYAYHIGQIVFIGKQCKGEAWKSLSIPKGKSTDYNQDKFAQEKSKTHFTVDFLSKKDKNQKG